MSTVTFKPPERSWLDRMRKSGFTARTVFDQGQHEDLKRFLLSHNGVAVVCWKDEPDKAKIIERGQEYSPRGAIMMRGMHNRCHENSYLLWCANRGKLRLVTGYAMCKSGVWRQHSWCVWPAEGKRTIVVETTVKARLYFGFELTDKEAIRFGDNTF